VTTVVLGSPDHDGPADLLAAIAAPIQAAGVPVIVVRLDPNATNDAAHEAPYRAALTHVRGPVIIGGFSLGARIAAKLCPELAPLALLCLGYPFHQAKRPSAGHGLEALAAVEVPTCIIQGTRDPHGSEAEVRGYALPDAVELVWLRDGNHRFVPRARSGLRQAEHIQAAAAAALAFIRGR